MNIKLDVKVGHWRYFTKKELKANKNLEASSKA